MDLTDSITPRSDQLNADDLMTGPRTVTITDVRKGNAEQPVDVVLAEYGDGRPFKPSKSMRRVMVVAWGPDSSAYTGRRMTIFRDPRIRFGKDEVGGIRISHLSHIDKPLTVALTVTRGKRASYTVQPLTEPAPTPAPGYLLERVEKALAAFSGIGIDQGTVEQRIGKPRAEWTMADIPTLLKMHQAAQQEQQPTTEDPEPPVDDEAADALWQDGGGR